MFESRKESNIQPSIRIGTGGELHYHLKVDQTRLSHEIFVTVPVAFSNASLVACSSTTANVDRILYVIVGSDERLELDFAALYDPCK